MRWAGILSGLGWGSTPQVALGFAILVSLTLVKAFELRNTEKEVMPMSEHRKMFVKGGLQTLWIVGTGGLASALPTSAHYLWDAVS